MNQKTIFVSFKIGDHIEVVDLNKLQVHKTFMKKVITFQKTSDCSYIIPESYDLFILYIDYIRYGRIISKNIDLMNLAITINTEVYNLDGFNEKCLEVVNYLITPQYTDIRVEDNEHTITGRVVYHPLRGKSYPHDIWTLTKGDTSVRNIISEGLLIFQYRIPTGAPQPPVIRHEEAVTPPKISDSVILIPPKSADNVLYGVESPTPYSYNIPMQLQPQQLQQPQQPQLQQYQSIKPKRVRIEDYLTYEQFLRLSDKLPLDKYNTIIDTIIGMPTAQNENICTDFDCACNNRTPKRQKIIHTHE